MYLLFEHWHPPAVGALLQPGDPRHGGGPPDGVLAPVHLLLVPEDEVASELHHGQAHDLVAAEPAQAAGEDGPFDELPVVVAQRLDVDHGGLRSESRSRWRS